MPLSRPPARLFLSAAGAAALAAATLLAAPAAFAAPANDNFADARLVSDMRGYDYQPTSGATKEAGEPAHAGNAGGSSIWYRWTAPTDSSVRVYSYFYQADGTAIGHELAVYTGSQVDSLTQVTAQAARYPYLTFHATAGETYSVAIDRAKKSPAGDAQFYLDAFPDNDYFSNARVIGGGSGLVTGHNGNANQESGEPDHAGTFGGDSVWYSWTAPTTGAVDFDTHGSDFDTLLGVYTGTAVNALTEVASNDDCVEDVDVTSCVEFDATAGTTYKIAVDGYNTDTGNISLTWEPGLVCTINGTDAAETLLGTTGDDVICGLGGDDRLRGGGGNDLLIGGTGNDTADYSTSPAGIVVDLRVGTATGEGSDTLQEIESVTGSKNNDRIDGDAGPNVLIGGAGSDALWGHEDVDRLTGGPGADTLGPGAGVDTVDGGPNPDTLHYGATPVPVSVDLATGTTIGDGNDTFVAVENIYGSRLDDTLKGDSGVNRIQGYGGDDALDGLGGNDQLFGDNGFDSLTGGGGIDTCNGGNQTDTATTCENLVSVP